MLYITETAGHVHLSSPNKKDTEKHPERGRDDLSQRLAPQQLRSLKAKRALQEEFTNQLLEVNTEHKAPEVPLSELLLAESQQNVPFFLSAHSSCPSSSQISSCPSQTSSQRSLPIRITPPSSSSLSSQSSHCSLPKRPTLSSTLSPDLSESDLTQAQRDPPELSLDALYSPKPHSGDELDGKHIDDRVPCSPRLSYSSSRFDRSKCPRSAWSPSVDSTPNSYRSTQPNFSERDVEFSSSPFASSNDGSPAAETQPNLSCFSSSSMLKGPDDVEDEYPLSSREDKFFQSEVVKKLSEASKESAREAAVLEHELLVNEENYLDGIATPPPRGGGSSSSSSGKKKQISFGSTLEVPLPSSSSSSLSSSSNKFPLVHKSRPVVSDDEADNSDHVDRENRIVSNKTLTPIKSSLRTTSSRKSLSPPRERTPTPAKSPSRKSRTPTTPRRSVSPSRARTRTPATSPSSTSQRPTTPSRRSLSPQGRSRLRLPQQEDEIMIIPRISRSRSPIVTPAKSDDVVDETHTLELYLTPAETDALTRSSSRSRSRPRDLSTDAEITAELQEALEEGGDPSHSPRELLFVSPLKQVLAGESRDKREARKRRRESEQQEDAKRQEQHRLRLEAIRQQMKTEVDEHMRAQHQSEIDQLERQAHKWKTSPGNYQPKWQDIDLPQHYVPPPPSDKKHKKKSRSRSPARSPSRPKHKSRLVRSESDVLAEKIYNASTSIKPSATAAAFFSQPPRDLPNS